MSKDALAEAAEEHLLEARALHRKIELAGWRGRDLQHYVDRLHAELQLAQAYSAVVQIRQQSAIIEELRVLQQLQSTTITTRPSFPGAAQK